VSFSRKYIELSGSSSALYHCLYYSGIHVLSQNRKNKEVLFKVYEEVEIYPNQFLTLAVDGMNGWFHALLNIPMENWAAVLTELELM